MIALGSSLAFSIVALAALAQDAISRGTILPVELESSLSLKIEPGKTVTARLVQSVPLSKRGRIRAGAKIAGHVTDVVSASASLHAQISFKFDQLVLSGRPIRITTNLLAIASYVEVEQAQLPAMGPDRGTPESAWTTTQVGGDTVYRGGGPVMEGSKIVGEPTYDGVLALIRPVPGSKCADAMEGNTPQALWVFSVDACGTYGFDNVTIAHSGRGDPRGEITLASTDGKLSISKGSGMLLQVMGDSSCKDRHC